MSVRHILMCSFQTRKSDKKIKGKSLVQLSKPCPILKISHLVCGPYWQCSGGIRTERKGDRETDSLETGFMISTIIRETLPKTFREVFPHFTVKYLFTQKKVSRFKSNQFFFLLEISHLHRHCEKEAPLGLCGLPPNEPKEGVDCCCCG